MENLLKFDPENVASFFASVRFRCGAGLELYLVRESVDVSHTVHCGVFAAFAAEDKDDSWQHFVLA